VRTLIIGAFRRRAASLNWRLVIDRSSVYATDVTKPVLQEPSFLILTALAAGPQHGYGIMTDVASISCDRIKLRAGTLYAALDRLRSDGIIDVDREEVVDGRLRRYYKLTQTGIAVLDEEVSRMHANVKVAARRLRTLAAGAS
jgi:DNA-binding PadR family transcriptional regulator